MQNLSRAIMLALLSILAISAPILAVQRTAHDPSSPISRFGQESHSARNCLTEPPPLGFRYESDDSSARPPDGGDDYDLAVCSADSARRNTLTPLNLGVDYVPLTGDDSMGFYAVYSAKESPEGSNAENNTGIFLFPLTNGNVLMFGAGYGDPFAPGTALYDAAYDMSRVDQVIRACLGRSPASSQIVFVTPHGHGDHINPAAFRELRTLGYTISEIWYHQADEGLLYALGGWSPQDLAARRPITGGNPCGSEVLSFSSPMGKIWFFNRPGHTPGSIDLVVDLENDINNRFVVRGSGTDGGCPMLDGIRDTVSPHGNLMLHAPPPQIANFSPQRGTPLGGTEVTLLGKNFLGEGAGLSQVLFGGVAASAVQIVNDTTLTAQAPASSGATVVDVAVVNRNGLFEIEGGYTYNAAPAVTTISPSNGSPSGGFRIVIDGSGFVLNEAGEATVLFGNVSSTRVRVKSDTQIVCRAPLGSPGSTVAVTVNNRNGRSNAGFVTFGGVMSVSRISPVSGPSSGGTEVTFHGKGLLNGGPLQIAFGAAEPTAVRVIDDTTAICSAPPGDPGQTVNVTVGNRSGSSVLLNGYSYNPFPRLTSISPPEGPPSGGTAITIEGFHFLDLGRGTTTILFGSRPAVDIILASENTITCTAPAAPDGPVDVTIHNANGSDVLVGAFNYETELHVDTVTPANASSLGGTQLTLTGVGFLADPGGINVSIGGQPASAVNVLDDAMLTCTLPGGQPGNSVNVVVGNSRGNVASVINGFRYYEAPTLAQVSPTNGPATGGTLVLLFGSGFQDNSAGTNSVMFANLPSPSVAVLGDTSLLCESPAGQAGSAVSVRVSNNNGTVTLAGAFTYDAPAPNLTSIVPGEGPADGSTNVTLTGSGFQAVNAGTTIVRFGSAQASNVSVVSDSTIQCIAPTGTPGNVDVTVENDNGSSMLAAAFRYLDGLTLTSLSPDHASPVGGTFITLTGEGFTSPTAGATSVRVGDTLSSTVNILSDTSLTFTMPPGLPGASVDVVVSNDNATASLSQAIRYHAAPSVASLSPATGSSLGGTNVLILGSGFLDDAAGLPTVEFGSVPASGITVVNDTSISCTTPTGNVNATVEVTVTNTNGTALLPNAFTYHAPVPTLSSIIPAEGTLVGGTQVTLTGSGFMASAPGANLVLFGATPATGIQVDSDSQISCTTPAGLAGSTDVTLTNDNGTATLFGAFRYFEDVNIASISPQSASSIEGTLLTITGAGFASPTAGVTTVHIGGLPAQNVTIVANDTITCTVPSGTPGTVVDVVASNDNASATLPGALRYHDLPTIAVLSPAIGPAVGGTDVLLSGTGFAVDAADTPTITFSGVAATGISVLDDSSIHCQSPPGTPAATVDIVLTNANGQATLVAGFTYNGQAPSLSLIMPEAGPGGGGTSVALTGSGFQAVNAGATSVRFGSVEAGNVQVLDDSTIQCTLPAGTPGNVVDITIENNNGSDVLITAFRYHAAPTLASLSPTTGSALGGTSVLILGSGFQADAAGLPTVEFGSVAATATAVLSDVSLICLTPPGNANSTVMVTVTNTNGTALLSNAFTYSPPAPSLSTLTPTEGPLDGGTLVTLSGSGFTALGAGATVVLVGSTPATGIQVHSDSQVSYTTPGGPPGLVSVTLLNDNGSATLDGAFRYLDGLSTNTITPQNASSLGGTLITIGGDGFTSPTAGMTSVTFDGVAANNVVIVDDDTLTCEAPAGTPGAVVDVVVQNSNATGVLTAAFRYHAQPTLVSISPDSGDHVGGTSMVLFGSGFETDGAGLPDVTFGGIAATSISVISDDTVFCTSPAGTPLTTVDVALSNTNGSGTLVGAFTYVAPVPTLTTIAPVDGLLLGGTTVHLSGSGFNNFSPGTNSVLFGNTPATAVTVLNDTELTCVTPASAAGIEDVILTNNNGAAILVGGFRFLDDLNIASISPTSTSSLEGTLLTISGDGFASQTAGVTTVLIGGLPAQNVTVVADDTMTCTVPSGTPGTSVDVVVSNDNASASLAGALRYHDLPTLAFMSPDNGSALGGTSVFLFGTGFLVDAAGTAAVTFDGVAASGITVLDNTSILCQTPPGTPAALVDVVLNNANGQATLTGAFQYDAPAPTLASISPAEGPPVGGTTVALTGTGYLAHDPGATNVLFGNTPGSNVQVTSDTQLTVTSPNGPAGVSVDVTVLNQNGAATLVDGFQYRDGVTVAGVLPANGRSTGGETITINGAGFASPMAGTTTVLFGSTPALDLFILSDSIMTVTAPGGASGTSVDVAVSNDNGTSTLLSAYRYNAAPVIGSLLPSSGSSLGDTLVTILGSGFLNDEAGLNTVTIGGLPATEVTAPADDTLLCKAPAGAPGAAADVSIVNANGQAFMASGYRYHALPSLTAVSPTSDSSRGGVLVTVQGTGFLTDNPGTNVVTFDGAQAAGVTVFSNEALTCLAPLGTPGAVVDISLSNGNGSASLLGAFRYHAVPEIHSLSLSEGSSLGGDFLSILGQGFLNDDAGQTTVAFDGIPAPGLTVLTDTELICSTPLGNAGALIDIVLSNANGDATLAEAFRYNDRPAVTSISPPNGSLNGSTFVTITGTGFSLFNAGSNLVTFDGTPAASVNVIDDNTITCLSPPGPGGTTAAISVSNANGEALFPNAFTYDDGPTLTSLLPASGTTAGGTSVLLFGQGFQNASSGTSNVTFGGLPATNVHVLADTAILCDTPTSNPGLVDVIVSNDNGQALFPAAFTYIAPVPTLDSISPASGTSLGDTLITLMGSGYSNYLPGENTILIGDLPANNVSVLSDSVLTCQVPAAIPGSVADVRLTNNNGSTEILAAFRYHSLPVLSSVSPADGTPLGGTSVTLIGTGFAIDDAGLPGVSFDGIPATNVTVIDDGLLTCLVPAGLDGAIIDVRLENANGAAALAGGFRYHSAPTIASISPESGSSLGGASLLILGTGFLDDGAGIPAVTIGANPVTGITVLDDTRITLNVPTGSAGSTTSIALSNSNGTAQLVNSFRYHDLPTLASVSPASGSPDGGETLVISGSGFQKDFAGTNTVLIDGVPALSVVVIDDMTLNCTTPQGPPGTFVEVRIANANGEVGLASAFRYHGRPVIASLDPASGPSLGGSTITINGGGFLDDDAGLNMILFGGVPTTDVTVLSDTTLTLVVPSGSPGSSIDVMIVNDNGQALFPAGYRYHAEPTLVSLSPTSGASAGNIQITVNGSGFLVDSPGINSLSIGGNPATGLTVLDDATLTCTLPPGAEGTTVDLAILNDNGGDILASAFTYNMPSPLTSIVPASGSSLGGATVTLIGNAFTASGTGTNMVFFGGIPALDVVTVNDTTITATIPAHTPGTSVDVTLRNGNGERTLVDGFFYYPVPTLTSITPTSGSALGGTGVLVFGTGFLSNNPGPLSVTFDGIPATSLNIFSDTAFLCDTPPGQTDTPVSIQVANANGSAELADAYQYTAPAPTVVAVTPPTGSPIGGTLVTIAGTGFNDFAPGTNLVTFGGVLATDVIVVDDTTLTCTAPAGTAGDVVDLRIQNDNGANVLFNAFRFNLPPALTSISPASGTSIGNTVVNISGMGFLDQSSGANTVMIGAVPAVNVVIVDDTMLTCVAPAGLAGSSVDVTVANVNGAETLSSAFRYHNLPTMASVTPNHGSSLGGDSVTLTGTGYQIDAAGTNDVTFDGAPATDVVVVDDTTITCTIPAGIAGGFATVQISNVNGMVAMPIAFRFHAKPVLTSASPTTGRSSGGTTLLLFGTGFMADNAGSNAISVGGNPATNIMIFSDSALLCDTPQGVRDEVVDIEITNANGSSLLVASFTYAASTPVLTSVTPQSGSFLGGTALTLKGKDFLDPSRGDTTINIGGQPAANLVIVDGETITVDAPPGTPDTLVDVVVSNDNGIDALVGGFRYAPMPTLTVLLPDNGSADGGEPVLLSGSGFTSYGAGVTTVTFDGIPATNILALDDSTISCLTPASPTAGAVDVVVVNTNGTAMLAGGFQYRMPPTLLSLSKLSGTSLGGDTMTLTGVNFSAAGAGAPQVMFGSVPATDTVVVDDTSITCTTPAGAGGSQIAVEVVNANGSSALASAYRYHELPTLTGLTPSQGTMMGGSAITVTGTGFLMDNPGPTAVRFGTSEATDVLVLDDATLTCLLPAGMPGATMDITVSNSNGAATLSGAFSYFPAPTLSSIQPSSGSALGGSTLTVSGSGFQNNAEGTNSILIGGAPATNISVLDDATLTLTVPSGSPGSLADIQISNANGTATLASSFRYHDAPNIVSVSPPAGSPNGGTSIVINGTGFQADNASTNSVTVGGQPAMNLTLFGDTAILCETPPGTAFTTVDIVLSNTNGTSTLPDSFVYLAPVPTLNSIVPNSGSSLGGTLTTITGTGFVNFNAGSSTVLIGGAEANNVTVLSDTTLTCMTPAGTSGALSSIEVTNANGTGVLPSAFMFLDSPSILGLSPAQGAMTGGTSVTITGTRFQVDGAGANTVAFGGLPASNVVVINDFTITCQTPLGTPGSLVDVSVSNANGTAMLVEGFLYLDTPMIVGVTPGNSTAMGGDLVTLSGSGFQANGAGVNTVTFGGAIASAVTVLDDTLLTCLLPAGPASDTVDVQVTNANGTGTLMGGFRYNALPTLSSLSPFSASSAGGTQIVVSGSGFQNDSPSTNLLTFGGVSATNVVVIDDATLSCEVPPGIPGTVVSVLLTNNNGAASLPTGFQYHGIPLVSGVAPPSASSLGGTAVLITGSAFVDNDPQQTVVTFDGIAATGVLVLDDSTISCVAPAGAPEVLTEIRVENANGFGTLPNALRYHALPTLTSAAPFQVSSLGGDTLTLTGTGFLADTAGLNVVTIAGTPATDLTVIDDTQVTCSVPTGIPGLNATIALANDNGTAYLPGVLHYNDTPTLTAVVPESGTSLGGANITLTGTGFLLNGAGAAIVLIGGAAATNVTVIDDLTLTCDVPIGAPGTFATVELSNANGSGSIPAAFRYHALPVLSALSPSAVSAMAGTPITLSGSGFVVDNAGANTVLFDGQPASGVVAVDDNTITCTVPVGIAGAEVDVLVNNLNGASTMAGAFSYHDAPAITAVSPSSDSSAGGKTVAISGTGFTDNDAGLNLVAFGGVPAPNVQVMNDVSLTCEVPHGPQGTQVDVVISNDNGGGTLGSAFRYHAAPVITGLSPDNVPPAGGTVMIQGTGFFADSPGQTTLTIGGLTATNIVVLNDTTIQCDVPGGASGTDVDVQLDNDNGSAILTGGLSYRILASLTGILPTSTTSLGGQLGVLMGSGFTAPGAGTTTITVDGGPATSVAVHNDTTITMDLPAGTPGATFDLVLTNDNGAVTLPAALRFHALPSITALSPDEGPAFGGQLVTITGSGFQIDSAATNLVAFAGIPATNVTVVDDNTITCEAPANASGAVDVTVENFNGAAMLPGAFSYFTTLGISGVSPAQGLEVGGTPITITGTGFLFETLAPSAVLIGATPAVNMTVVDDNTITCETPAGLGGSTVVISVSNTTSTAVLASGFFYIPEPTIGGLTPPSGTSLGGDTVTLSGAGFLGFGAGLPFITFEGAPAANVAVIDDSTVTCELPAGAAGTLVTVDLVNNNGSYSAASSFRYHALPTIATISPDLGATPGGQQVTLTGTGFQVDSPGTNVVSIAGTAASNVVVIDDNTLTCEIPPSIDGSFDVALSNANGSDMLPGAFSYYIPLELSTILPTTGYSSGGTAITLTGSGFTFETLAAGAVTIGGLAVLNPVVVDDTTITCESPLGAPGTSAPVAVANSTSQANLGAGFFYLAEPAISGIAPPNGTSLGGTQVTLTGSGFLNDGAGIPTITFDATPALNVVVADDATITCETPVGIATLTAQVHLSNLRGTAQHGFTYHPTPMVTALTPDRVDPAGGTNVTITGSGFIANDAGANIVTFGVSLATNIIAIDDTTITCDAPAGTLRAGGDLTVRNSNGANTLPGAIQWIPQIPADINNDGYADLIVGAPGHTVTSVNDGAVYAFLGGPGGIADADAGTADLTLLPTMQGSEFGARVASMDVSGDDIPDLLVSAYKDDTVGLDAGAVYIFLGPLSASPIPTLSTDADIILLGKTAGDFFGTSIDSGDISGDGIADILVGAKLNDGLGTDAGEAYAFFGGPDLTSTTALSASATFTPMNVRSEFGTQVRAVDFDLDGTCDVLIGAPKDSVAGGNSGSVYIFQGNALMGTEAAVNADWSFDGEASGDFFGTSIAIGDVNVDGTPDLVVGAPLSDRTAKVAGAAYVFFGGPAQTGTNASTADVLFGAERLGDRMGNALDVADVNGDGIDDILIGSPFSSVTENQAGRAYVVFGGVNLASIELSLAPVIFTAESNVGDHFGTVVTAQDVDGDGVDDVIISANMNDANGPASGRTYVFMGGPGLTDTAATIGDATLSGEASEDGFGSSIVGTR